MTLRFPEAAAEFQRNFDARGELGASLAIWHEGAEVLQLAAGWQERERRTPWNAETKVLVWSATKGPASACVLRALEQRGLPLSAPVVEIWPEFAAAGKARITFAELLAHRSGLPATEGGATIFDHEAVVRALAAQAPLWPPGAGHGYSPRTFGFLLDELVRRLAGVELATFWREQFAEPMALPFFIGVPENELANIANIYAAPAAPRAPEDVAFGAALADPHSITARAFATPHGIAGVSVMNDVRHRTASFPAFGGIGTARALAQFYSMLAEGGVWRGRRYLAAETVAALSVPLSSGLDRTLCKPTAFSTGFMLDPVDATGAKVRQLFGPARGAFGHPGSGGCTAFADPENRLAFAYTMNQMEPGVLPGGKAVAIIRALYG